MVDIIPALERLCEMIEAHPDPERTVVLTRIRRLYRVTTGQSDPTPEEARVLLRYYGLIRKCGGPWACSHRRKLDRDFVLE